MDFCVGSAAFFSKTKFQGTKIIIVKELLCAFGDDRQISFNSFARIFSLSSRLKKKKFFIVISIEIYSAAIRIEICRPSLYCDTIRLLIMRKICVDILH
jgi:hypothetical protein